MRRRSWVKEMGHGWVQEGEEHKESSSKPLTSRASNLTSKNNHNNNNSNKNSNIHNNNNKARVRRGSESSINDAHFRTNTRSSVINALSGFTRATQLFNENSESVKQLKKKLNDKNVPSHKSPVKRSYRDRSLFAKAKRHAQLYNSHTHNNEAKKINQTNDANVAECLNATVEERQASIDIDDIQVQTQKHDQNDKNDNNNNDSTSIDNDDQQEANNEKDDTVGDLNSSQKEIPTVTKIHVAAKPVQLSEFADSQISTRRSSIWNVDDSIVAKLAQNGFQFPSSYDYNNNSLLSSFDGSMEFKQDDNNNNNEESCLQLSKPSNKVLSIQQNRKYSHKISGLEDISEEYNGLSEPLYTIENEYLGRFEFSGIEINDPTQWDDILQLSKSHLVICEIYCEYFGPCNVMNPFIDEILHEYGKDIHEIRTQSENLDEKYRCRLPIQLCRININEVERKLQREIRLLGSKDNMLSNAIIYDVSTNEYKLNGLQQNSAFQSPIPLYALFKNGNRIAEMKGANANKLKTIIYKNCYQTPQLSSFFFDHDAINYTSIVSSDSLSNSNSQTSFDQNVKKYQPIFHLRTNPSSSSISTINNGSDSTVKTSAKDLIRARIEAAGQDDSSDDSLFNKIDKFNNNDNNYNDNEQKQDFEVDDIVVKKQQNSISKHKPTRIQKYEKIWK